MRVGGSLEALLFVDERGRGELLFDTDQFVKSITSVADQEIDLGPLTFDPRGKSIQISRHGQVLLEASFPARPSAGRLPVDPVNDEES